MITADGFKRHCAHLIDSSISHESRRDLASEIRDSMELTHSIEYPNFLANYLPAFQTVLRTTTSPQHTDNPVNKTRSTILEVISRLPLNECVREHLLMIFTVCLEVLQNDNEENAVTAIHTILELFKNFRNELASHVQPFLDFVIRLYESFGTTIETLLSVKSPLVPQVATGQAHARTRYIPPSNQSFKVVTECPLVVMFVFRLFSHYKDPNMTYLCPLMVRAIEYEVATAQLPPQLSTVYQDFIASQVKTVTFLVYLLKQSPEHVKTDRMSVPRSVVKLLQASPGGSVAIRKELIVAIRFILNSAFREGVFEQIDLLLDERVLVGTGRAATDNLRPLAYSFLIELIYCKRFDLSIAQLNRIIYMFSTNIHDPKFSHVLQTSSVRLLMNLIEGILKIHSTDNTKGEAARGLLIRILETMVTKYVTLGEQVPNLLKRIEELRATPDPISSGKRLSDLPSSDPIKEVVEFKNLLRTLTPGLKTVIWSAMNIHPADGTHARITQGNPGAPAQTMPGVNLFNDPSIARPPSAPGAPDRPGMLDQPLSAAGGVSFKSLTEKECELIAKLLPAGQKCFRLYSRLEKANGGPSHSDSSNGSGGLKKKETNATDLSSNTDVNVTAQLGEPSKQFCNVVCATSQEEREIFELFGQVFTVLDVISFQDIFGLRMNDLFEHIVENPQAITIPQHFLANAIVSKYFADILLNFLVDNLEMLDVPTSSESDETPEGKRASALLRLFRILFASVNLFPDNEPVLRPHVATIVRKSLKFAAQAEDPHSYLQLLRCFFKSINGGKHNAQFELLYREFCPFIEPLFLGLMALYNAPNNSTHRNLIVELCLIAPARPSTIFPYLELQMKPVVWSLKSSGETSEAAKSHGLRALEFWVDMLQPSFFDSLLARVEPNIVSLLQDHLYSTDSGHAKYAARILGKLGPRARFFKTVTKQFDFKEHSEVGEQLLLSWKDGNYVSMRTDEVVKLSTKALMDERLVSGSPPSWKHKAIAWKFLYSCLVPMFGICEQNESDQRVSTGLTFGVKQPDRSSDPMRDKPRTTFSNKSEENFVKSILIALISTCHIPNLKEALAELNKPDPSTNDPVDCILGVCRYFASLAIQELSSRTTEDRKSAPFEQNAAEEKSWRSLSPSLFTSSCITVLSSERNDHFESGLKCFKVFLQSLVSLSTGYIESEDPYVKHAKSLLRERNERQEQDEQNRSKMDIVGEPNHGPSASNPSNYTPTAPELSKAVDNTPQNALGKPFLKQVSVLPSIPPPEGYPRTLHMGERLVVARHVSDLVEQLSHACHKRDWNMKRAGVYGIEIVYDVVPEMFMRTQYYVSTHFHSIRALGFVSRGASVTVSKDTIRRVKKLIFRVLDYCFLPGDDPSARTAVLGSKYLKDLILRTGGDLATDCSITREITRLIIEHLAKGLGAEVYDMVRPLRDSMIRPLSQRPIRQHSLGVQIGYIECLIFFLVHGKEKFTPDLFVPGFRENVLNECIIILDSVPFDPATEAEEGFRYRPHDNKFFNAKNTRLVLTLRRKIIEFLCNIAVYSNELQDPSYDRLFRSVISCFFRCLQSGDSEVVKSSKIGLKQAIAKHPKPKELLQTNLRPILGNLADYKKLSIPYLQGLSRVLELFSHWFNLSLGDRLLEHLQRWTEPAKLASQIKWTPGTESKIGAAILDLFHLLPLTAAKFLPKIVPMVIMLESVLPVAGPGVAHLGLKGSKAASTSPYRAPLLRYCNHHSSASASYFLQHIDDGKMRQLLMVMIRCPDSFNLRKDLMDHPKRLLPNVVFNQDISFKTPFHVISLIDLLSDQDIAWLASDSEIILKLTFYWQQLCQVPDVFVQGPTTLFRIEEMKTIANIFIKYCSHFETEVNLLFELLPVFLTRTVCDFTYVKDFLKKSVSRDGSHATKKLIITKFLHMFQDSNISQERKIHSLQYLVIPMVCSHLQRRKQLNDRSVPNRDESPQNGNKPTSMDVSGNQASDATQRPPASQLTAAQPSPQSAIGGSEIANQPQSSNGSDVVSGQGQAQGQVNSANAAADNMNLQNTVAQDEVLDAALIQRIMKEILDQNDDVLRHYNEPLSAELLRLVTELIKYMPRELGSYRKELIKFGWGHLRREEPMAKHWAFVYVTTFFEAYQAPGRIVLQVYVALLRAYHGEGRELVQQALNILTPALPKRLGHNPNEHRFPIWIRYTKKILLEEGHNTPNLMHILHLICRHYMLFFVARSWFVPIMSQTLTRVGLNSNATPESRRFCVDLISVIIKWEHYRRFGSVESTSDLSSKKRPREPSSLSGQDGVKAGSEAGRNNEQVDQEPPTKTKKTGDGQAVPTASSQQPMRDSDNFQPSDSVVDTIFGFLVQVPFKAADRREAPLLLRRCLSLIEEASKLWGKCNVNLSFVEKSYAQERQTLAQQKQLMRSSGADGKPLKPETKLELARLKKSANRPAILYTSLSLMSAFTKHQKQCFVDKNIQVIRALIKPALLESDSQTASQCISLLSELLQVYPIQGRSVASQENAPGSVTVTPSLLTEGSVNQTSPMDPNQQKIDPPTEAQAVYLNTHEAILKNLCSEEPMRVYYGFSALHTIADARPQEFIRHQDNVVKAFQRLKERFNTLSAHGTVPSTSNGGVPQSQQNEGTTQGTSPASQTVEDPHRHDDGLKIDFEVQAIRLSLSLLGRNVATLESTQRKILFQLLCFLIDNCHQVPIPILLEIVDVVSTWVFWSPREDQKAVGLTKDPLTPKDKTTILHKLVSFERVTTEGADQVMKAFLRLILRICGGENIKEKRSELVSKLEKVFLLGLKTDDPIREKFFNIFNDSIDYSLSMRIIFLISRQDWESFGNCMWIRYACETLIASAISDRILISDMSCARFPRLLFGHPRVVQGQREPWRTINDSDLQKFVISSRSWKTKSFLEGFRLLLQMDEDVAHYVWVDLFPKIWSVLGEDDRGHIERGLTNLLSREFHQAQMNYPQSNVRTMLEGIVQCKPLPVLRAQLVQHLGSRWNGWHAALAYFENRASEIQELMDIYPDATEATMNIFNAETEDLRDAQIRMFRMLHEKDYLFGVWKVRAKMDFTFNAITYEQLGQYRQALELYNQGILENFNQRNIDLTGDGLASKEFMFWEESWINCARNLCEWDMLTEFSRTVMNHELMHECLWRVPDWSALKELLVRNPTEDGPQLKLYEAYLYMQENKMEAADKSISEGIERAIQRFKILPDSADMDSRFSLLVNFQQFVELTESASIFEELATLSGQTTQLISVDQKVDNVRLRLNTWRERLPAIHEPLRIWSDILTWRNHMHAVIVNVLENLKEAANARAKMASAQNMNNPTSAARNQGNAGMGSNQSQSALSIIQSLPQQVMLMGVNETAWNVHRFARASRKQGFPEVALYAMNKMYPFSSMDLAEYFVKTKELSRSFLARPNGLDRSLENGLHEINRCNMKHFNSRQRAQLFTVKAKILNELDRTDEAADALRISLNTSSDVGSTWLTWGKHCDKTQNSLSENTLFAKVDANLDKKLSTDDPLISNFKTELAWREAAANCYLQAIRFGSRSARPYLCRVLRLVTVDLNSRRRAEYILDSSLSGTKLRSGLSIVDGNNQNKVEGQLHISGLDQNLRDSFSWSINTGVSKVISAMRKEVPVWMWIPWLSQMVHMLLRMEGAIIRPIITSIGQHFPQALFFLLRSFLEERKNMDKPTKVVFREAMKTGRPLLPPLRTNNAIHGPHLLRQMQIAKENIQRLNVRYNNQRRIVQEIQKKMANPPDPNERAHFETEISKLKEAHAVLDKTIQAYRLLQAKYQQVMASSRGSSSGDRGAAGIENWQQQDQAQKRESGQGESSNSTQQGGTAHEDTDQSTGIFGRPTPFEQADSIMTQLVKAHPGLALEMERLTLEISSRLKPHRVEHLLNIISALLRKCYRISMKPGRKIDATHRTALIDVSKMCFRTGMEPDPNEQKLPPAMVELKRAFEAELAPQVSKDFPDDLELFIMRLRRWQNIFQRHVNAFPDHVKMENISKHLMEVKELEVEVFGQYSNADHVEPAPDRHVKIEQFGSEVQVVHGSSYLSRGLKVIGSDGREYEYALETSAGIGSQAAEDRVVQMYRLLNNWVFNKDAVAHQRRIHISTPTLVPTGSRTRLISLENNTSTLIQGLDKFLEENGKDPDDAISLFRNLSSDLVNRRIMDIELESSSNATTNVAVNTTNIGTVSVAGVNPNANNGSSGSNPNAAVIKNTIAVGDRINLSPSAKGIRTELILMSRVEAFEEICEKHVPDTCLSQWVGAKMLSWSHRFMFTKRFAETLAATGIVSHCIGVGARRPQTMIVQWNTGCVSPCNVRVLTSPSGILESDEAVPFRLTRNIIRMLGPIGMEGALSGAMACTLNTMQKQFDLIEMWSQLILRDELGTWVNSRLELSGYAHELRRTAAFAAAAAASNNNTAQGGRPPLDNNATEDLLRRGHEFTRRINQEEYRLLEDRLTLSITGLRKRVFGQDSSNIGAKGELGGANPKNENDDDGSGVLNSSRRGQGDGGSTKSNAKASVGREEVGETVSRWISKARKTENQAFMETTWQPWY